MSNVIKSHQSSFNGQKLVPTKTVSSTATATPGVEEQSSEDTESTEALQQEYQELTTRIEALQKEESQLLQQIEQKKEESQREIEQWWEEKQEELQRLTNDHLQKAKEEGFREGYDQGLSQIHKEMQEQKNEMNELLGLAYQQKKEIIEDAEPFLLSLAIEISRQILQQELSLSEEQLLQYVQSALQQVGERDEITLEVSAYDYPIVNNYQGELQQCISPATDLKIIPSSAMTSTGGCIIHTPKGSFDVTLDSQLDEMKGVLLQVFEESGQDL